MFYLKYNYALQHFIVLLSCQFRPIGLVGRVFANGCETDVQSQVESYQELKKCFLIHSCLTLSIIRYLSRVKCNGEAPSPSPQCSGLWKGSLQVALDDGRQFYFTYCLVMLHFHFTYNLFLDLDFNIKKKKMEIFAFSLYVIKFWNIFLFSILIMMIACFIAIFS